MKTTTSTTDVSLAMTENSDEFTDSLDLTPSGGTPMDRWLACLRPLSKAKMGEEEDDDEIQDAAVPKSIAEASTLTKEQSTIDTNDKNAVVDLALTTATKLEEPLGSGDFLLALLWIVFSVLLMTGSRVELVKSFGSVQESFTSWVSLFTEKVTA